MIVDKREKNSLVVSELAGKTQIQLEHLKVADYIVGDVAIERKTVSDFVRSMINKRLARQLQELKQYPKQLLIIEGEFEESKINPNAIKGMLLSILLDFSIPIIFTKDCEDTASFLLLLEKRTGKKKEISLKTKKKTFSLAEQQQLVLESFPGIGPITAKKLLKKFKTIKKIINTSSADLKKILNKKKIDTFKKILTKKYVNIHPS